MRSASESVGSASLHTRYVLDTHVVVVLALGCHECIARIAPGETFAQKAQKLKNDAKTAHRLKFLKVGTIKGGLALKVFFRAPKCAKA